MTFVCAKLLLAPSIQAKKKSPSTADLVIGSSTDQNVVLRSKSTEGSDTGELCWQMQRFPPAGCLLLAHWTATSLCSCHLLQQDTQGAESMTALPKCLERKRRRKEWSLQDEQCTKMPAGTPDPLPCFSWLQFPFPHWLRLKPFSLDLLPSLWDLPLNYASFALPRVFLPKGSMWPMVSILV